MVDFIDIKELNLEELSGVVSLYPWFAGARKELCMRLNAAGACSGSQLSSAALYVSSPRVFFDMVRAGHTVDCSDSNVSELIRAYIEGPAEEQEKSSGEVRRDERRIFVVGGDYFSQDQYRSVRRSDDSVFSSFATKARAEGYVEEQEPEDSTPFCTETLAQIYLEQGYRDEAKDIYSKLSLRYPEKSVYFAALIDKINNN